ncbi:hypothetical protein EDD31_1361 [Bogoriella caseilytica]|uniref:Uncharacterized protein n=1 Tax=Bogoriella caseilytica TaxID=56055 RepID=A0A3N2BCM3_9MICO|nr:hypothetical protein EDD31_1361 [Bogoriella caseilytica]
MLAHGYSVALQENVLITPHVGQGLATYEIPAAESERLVRLQCLGTGEVTIRVDGEERFSEDCQGVSQLSMGLTADGEGNRLENDVPVHVEVIANNDLYWVIGAAASSSG